MADFAEVLFFSSLVSTLLLLVAGSIGYYLMGRGIIGIAVSQLATTIGILLVFIDVLSRATLFGIFFSNIFIVGVGVLVYYWVDDSLFSVELFQLFAGGIVVLFFKDLVGVLSI